MPEDTKEHLVSIARLVFSRQLTDASGGNISVRQAENIFMTPAHAGSRQQWQINPSDVVVLDAQGNLLDGPDRRSRESQVHLRIYESFPLAGAVIHAQAGYLMAFVAAGRPIPPVLEHTWKFGTIGLARCAKAHSAELAQSVVEAFEQQKEQLQHHAIATLIPQHGIVVVGRNLDDAFESLDRIETNAQAILLGALLRSPPEGG